MFHTWQALQKKKKKKSSFQVFSNLIKCFFLCTVKFNKSVKRPSFLLTIDLIFFLDNISPAGVSSALLYSPRNELPLINQLHQASS